MSKLPEKVAKYFPYAQAREFQDQYIKIAYNAVENGQSAVLEGSNGLGKTIAALAACLPKAVEEDFKILYVARTHRQHDRVIEELKSISEKQNVSGISIRGRHEMCLNLFVKTHAQNAQAVMEICELLKTKNRCPYYRNIEEKKNQFYEVKKHIASIPYKSSEIQKICQSKGFCPYELVKASVAEVNVIALSYLYVFDPIIRNAFLKNFATPLDRMILIVDEAHNLPETASEIAGSVITLFAVKHAETEAKQFKHRDIEILSKTVKNGIQNMAKQIQKEQVLSPNFLIELIKKNVSPDNPKKFLEQVYATGIAIRRDLLLQGRSPRSFIHSMGDFLLKWVETVNDESFVRVLVKYRSKNGAETAKLEIAALDPSKITEPVFSETHSNIIMSGTLQPLDAYVQITKLPSDTVKQVLPSPFPKEHVLPLICCDVTTAMEKRTPEMYNKITERIKEVVQNTPANTGVFTASFEVLESLLNNGLEKDLGKPVFREHRNMNSKDNENMISEFKAHAKAGGAVLLGVQGGRSSEGVDFPGDQMNSVAVVGVPYAEPTPKVRAQIEYFEKRFPKLGREYGYVIPAMKKASQAAGRPIRTLEDRGAIIFMDHRFSTSYCQRFLPTWIRDNVKVIPDSRWKIAQELRQFFKIVS